MKQAPITMYPVNGPGIYAGGRETQIRKGFTPIEAAMIGLKPESHLASVFPGINAGTTIQKTLKSRNS